MAEQLGQHPVERRGLRRPERLGHRGRDGRTGSTPHQAIDVRGRIGLVPDAARGPRDLTSAIPRQCSHWAQVSASMRIEVTRSVRMLSAPLVPTADWVRPVWLSARLPAWLLVLLPADADDATVPVTSTR